MEPGQGSHGLSCKKSRQPASHAAPSANSSALPPPPFSSDRGSTKFRFGNFCLSWKWNFVIVTILRQHFVNDPFSLLQEKFLANRFFRQILHLKSAKKKFIWGESHSPGIYHFCTYGSSCIISFWPHSFLCLFTTYISWRGEAIKQEEKEKKRDWGRKRIITWTDEHKYDKIKFNIYRWKYGVRIPDPDPEAGSDPDPQHWFHDRLG